MKLPDCRILEVLLSTTEKRKTGDPPPFLFLSLYLELQNIWQSGKMREKLLAGSYLALPDGRSNPA
jgi:hypothetical protein